MAIRTVRLGSERVPGEGLRIGTVMWIWNRAKNKLRETLLA